MIPKIIHYCWFGGKPLDELALKCINSWKEYFPDYEIIQWNEQNFDINQMEFMKKAYMNEKWAFVSDVARLIVIYNFGGLYFDTDVEIVSNYEDILKNDIQGFMGYEKTNAVTTGSGFGAVPKHPFVEALINVYKDLDYEHYAECLSEIACPILTTQLLVNHGYIVEDRMQKCCNLLIYPSEYFSPIDYMSGRLTKTELTHSIHWYNGSWNTEETKKELAVAQRLRRVFGTKMGEIFYGVISCIKKEGLVNYVLSHLKKAMP